MTVERELRLMAGIMVLLSISLAYFSSRHWIWLTAFVEPAAIGVYQLVPRDGDPAWYGIKRGELRHQVRSAPFG
jgi:hypothetical protein